MKIVLYLTVLVACALGTIADNDDMQCSADTPRRKIRSRISGDRLGPGGIINRILMPEDAVTSHLKPFVFLENLDGDVPAKFGFGLHPHSGIASLTYQLNKDLSYIDTAQNEGVLKTQGLEWMQSGGGAWHKAHVVGTGPIMSFQLWLALPPGVEDAPAFTRFIAPEDVPQIKNVRVLLGSYLGHASPIQTPTPVNYFDVSLQAGNTFTFFAPGHAACWAYVFEGTALINGKTSSKEFVVFSDDGVIEFEARDKEVRFLVASAVHHDHELHHGYASVHTNPTSLQQGQAKIHEIGTALRNEGKM